MTLKIVQMITRGSMVLLLATAGVFAQAETTELPKQDQKSVETQETASEETGKDEQSGPLSALVEEEQVTSSEMGYFARTYGASERFSIDSSEKLPSPAKQTSGSGWQFAFAPYLYMTGMTGTIGAQGEVVDVDMDFVDVFNDLNLGIMGAFEARKGRFVLVNDLMWIKLGEERDTPGGLFSSVKLGVNMFIWDPEVGYNLYQGDAGSFDVLGGFRLMSVENNVNFRAGTLPAFDVSERKTWATPVFGARGVLNLNPKFFLTTKFDIGGGLGADFTGQFYGGAGFRISPKVALIGGYRYMKTDYDSEAGFLFDTTMNGVLLGAKFTF